MIKIGRRGSQNGTLVVTGTQGHVAYPELADNPVRGIAALMVAVNAQPLDGGTDHFGPSNLEFTSIDVGNKTVNLIPAEARARFNIRFNDTRTRAELRDEVERRVARAAGRIRWRIEWEPSNSDVFLTTPGPFVDMIGQAITEVTGRTPALSTTGGTSDARFIKDYCPVIEFGLLESADAQDRRARRDRRPRGADGDLPAHPGKLFPRMIPKKPAPDLIRGGNRFSDWIMRKV